jgi:hypothetical protein
MAREKNTYRASARRRSRAVARENRDAAADTFAADDADMAAETATSDQPRSGLFTMPHVREDIAALPEIFRTRRRGIPIMWLPFILIIVGFVLALLEPFQGLDAGIAGILAFYVQTFFIPTGLLTFLLAGFMAPRASYLVGFIVGVFNAVLLVIAFGVVLNSQIIAVAGDQASTAIFWMIGYALLIGPLAAAFAAWYRNFLNRMNTQSRDRRIAREVEAAKKRKEEARAARRPVRTKTSA